MDRVAQKKRFFAEIPRWYSGVAHIVLVFAFGIAMLIISALQIHAPTWQELMLVPGFFVFANFFEWFVHKGPLHHRRPGMGMSFERHTLQHHVYFTHEDMQIHSVREIAFVMFPSWGVLMLGLPIVPIALAFGYLVSANAGWLFVFSGYAYYIFYEAFHAMHHLPQDRGLGATRLWARLRELHQLHHDPKVMTRWNFNIMLPLADIVMGTYKRRE
jgi:hypothetical protein